MIGLEIFDFETAHQFWRAAAQDLLILGAVGTLMWKVIGKRWYVDFKNGQKAHEMVPELGEAVKELDKKIADSNDRLDEKLSANSKKMDQLLTEMTPNHGTSMRDAINRIEALGHMNQATFRGWLAQDAKPMYITDNKGSCIWVNRAMVEMTNRDSSELLGHGWLNVVEPSELERVRAESVAGIADKRDIIHYYNVTTGDPDFPLIPVEATSVAIYNADNDLTGYIGSLKRLDEHYDSGSNKEVIQLIEEENAVNRDMMRAWWYGNPSAMFESTMDGSMIWINKAYSELVGQTLHEIQRDGWQEHVDPSDVKRITEEATLTMETIGAASFKYRIAKTGQLVKADAWPLKDAHGKVTGLLGTLKPIEG